MLFNNLRILEQLALALEGLTLPMLRLLLAKAQVCKDFGKASKPCHVGIHWIALTEHSHMRTHMPRFQSFSSFFCVILYWSI